MDSTKILLVEDDPNDVELIQLALDTYTATRTFRLKIT